jgi:hypothetical protein
MNRLDLRPGMGLGLLLAGRVWWLDLDGLPISMEAIPPNWWPTGDRPAAPPTQPRAPGPPRSRRGLLVRNDVTRELASTAGSRATSLQLCPRGVNTRL